MKLNFKTSLLILTSTFSALPIINNINVINFKETNIWNYKTIKATAKISKTISAEAQGDVALNQAINNLRYRHSEFSPTGIFVTKNSKISIDCPNISNVYAVVGQWGKYKNLNHGQELRPEQIALNPGKTTTFQPNQNGVLYISNQNFNHDVKLFVDVDNGIEIPTFTLNQTTSEEFNQKLNATNSPFVELIGKNFFGTFQIALANELWKNNLAAINKLNSIIKNWDEIYRMSNYVSGLSLDFDGVAQKHHNLIHITNPDTGGGSASATNYFLRFHQGGIVKNLFKEKSEQWGLWHETGHTYQNPDYVFDGFSEVTVNINSFWIQEEQGFKNRLFGYKDTIAAIKKYINSNNPNKTITDLDVWGRLGIFLQLHMAYGKEFFPTLNQEYRLLAPAEKPKNNDEKYQTFIKLTSKTVNRNLIPFFEKWGIHANNDTKQAVSNYPLLTTEIWNNIFDDHIEDKAIVDYQLAKYQPLSGVQVKETALIKVNVGDKVDKTAVQNALDNVASDMTIGAVAGPDWNTIDWNKIVNKNYATVNISQPGKMSNKYLIPTEVTANNSVRILGLGDTEQGIVGLNTTEQKFFIAPKNSQLHSYFKGEAYVKITVTDAKGNIVYNQTANGDDATMKFNQLNKLKYQDNYQITFWFAEPSRGLYFDQKQWNKVKNTGSDSITFIISKNNLVIKKLS